MSSQASPFPGFPASARAVAVPSLFFSQVLPQIERPEELIVTVYLFFAQGRTKGRRPPFLTDAELAADTGLMRALSHIGPDPQAALARGLALAVERGTLLRAQIEPQGRRQEVYLVHTQANRRALAGLSPTPVEEPAPPAAVDRANIFALYEENIGTITPLIADELRDAEERYPWQWLTAAFHEAAALNKRSWRYIQAILRRWEAEGPNYEALGSNTETDAGRKRPLSGRYRHVVRR